jgi:hypothetical protein
VCRFKLKSKEVKILNTQNENMTEHIEHINYEHINAINNSRERYNTNEFLVNLYELLLYDYY